MKAKLTYSLLSILLTIFFTACSKGSDPQPGAFDCQLKESVLSGLVFKYEFSSNGLVSKATVVEKDNPLKTTIHYTYNNAAQLVKRESVTAQDYSTGKYSTYFAYRYENGLISEMDYYEEDERIYTDTFTYDEHGRPVKIVDDIGYEALLTYYDDGNLKNETLYESGVIKYKVDYADYDDKERPLKATKGEVTPQNVSKNNPQIEIEYFYDNGHIIHTREFHYSYQYNSKNLPVTIQTTPGSPSYYRKTYSYTCD